MNNKEMMRAIRCLHRPGEPGDYVAESVLLYLGDMAEKMHALMPTMPPCVAGPNGQGGAELYWDAPTRRVHLIARYDEELNPFMYVAVKIPSCWVTGTIRNPAPEGLANELMLFVAMED